MNVAVAASGWSAGHPVHDCAAEVAAFAVIDTGIGISADKFEVIFDPFVQVKSDSAAPAAGVGLGLAISRGLARAMQGEITVESTLGEGATFTLALPRSATAPRVSRETKPA